jgi:hypothetical protein
MSPPLYGAEHYLRGRQLLGHSIVSQHFMEPEGSIPISQELSTSSHTDVHSIKINSYTVICLLHRPCKQDVLLLSVIYFMPLSVSQTV